MPACVRTFSISLSTLTTTDFDASTPRGHMIRNCFKQTISELASVSFRNQHHVHYLSQVDIISTARANTVTGVVVTFSVQAEEAVLDRLCIQMTDDRASGLIWCDPCCHDWECRLGHDHVVVTTIVPIGCRRFAGYLNLHSLNKLRLIILIGLKVSRHNPLDQRLSLSL